MTGPHGPQEFIKAFHRGSDSSGSEFRYLAVGRVSRAHGLKGEVSMEIMTDFPERFETAEWFYIGNEQEAAPYRLESYRWHQQKLLLTLAGVTNRAEAEQLTGQFVQIPVEEAMPLEDGNFYLFQLIGLEAVTTTHERLGCVTNILETGANDVLVIQNDEREVLLPDIPDVVKSIDLERKLIIVELIDGLI